MRAQHRQSSGIPRARVWSVVSMIGRVITTLAVVVAAGTVLTLAWFNVHHQQVLIVTSGSMAPAFNAGDAVTVEPPEPSKLAVGDVVTFRTSAGDKTTTHRIVALKPQPEGLFLQTKGDANKTPDPNLISAKNVTGVMTGEIPQMGFWLAFYQSRTGKLVVLGTPLLLILLAQAFSTVGDFREAHASRRDDPRDDAMGALPASSVGAGPPAPGGTTSP